MLRYHKSLKTLNVLLGLCLSSIALGQNDDRYNYRDQCRSIIAGKYWKSVDAQNRSQLYLEMKSKSLKNLVKEKKKTTDKLSKLKKSTKTYDPARDDQVRILTSRLSFLKKSIADAEKKIPEIKTELNTNQKRRDELKDRMSKVFSIEEKPADNTGTVPKSIKYKTSCPTYRHVCPLPAAERKALLAIFIRETVPTPCLKYSYIR